MLKLVNGTACYTGGGIYIFVGSTNDGNYFLNTDYGFQIFDSDPTFEDADGNQVGFWCNWQEYHDITDNYDVEEMKKAWKDFYHDFINEKEGIDYHFENWSNYSIEEIKKQDWEELEF